MDWRECQERMDQYVIKKDGTAVDTEYFMATHVPFRDLEVIEYGHTDVEPIQLSEEEIYKRYIVNPSNKHQMIIVRGSHGSGKSHLICWLHNRFVNDSENYDPSSERVIFLRRLGNTVRGAVQQMLDEEDLVKDPEVREKFEKFTHSSQSQSKDEFKTTIYTEYAKKVTNDSSGESYRPATCKDIASFLYDQRVQEYMMRSDGPVERCYQMISGGANSTVTEEMEDIFQASDFQFPRDVDKAVKNISAVEVQSFYKDDLRKDEEAQKKLAGYLNQFTSGVIQGCANITSENARDLFVDLRKSLYKEGRNLTIFIEDFTSFSIVESELITALAVEHGGNYGDLCRVTSVIGITDGYYESFRGNFMTRVTSQIKVTEQAFSDEDFLLEMTARYLNAIYCTTSSVMEWYQSQPAGDSLPDADFKPDYDWDEVKIGDSTFTLYPFDKKSIILLSNNMQEKTTRNFLTYVIQHFFLGFADGMQYGDDWKFPDVPSFIATIPLQPPFSDTVENASIPDADKKRLNVLFSTWGDGTTEAVEYKIGGIRKEFLQEIGLGNFSGIRSGEKQKTENEEKTEEKTGEKGEKAGKAGSDDQPRTSPEDKSFERHKGDIEGWYYNGATLQFSADFSKWLGDFVAQGIPWQDEGLPGDLVSKRRSSGGFVYIEDSAQQINRDKAVVILERSYESYIILMGLNLFDYHKKWTFDDADYYQYMMITWLEKNKSEFIEHIFGESVGKREHPIMTWCLASEYFFRLLQGEEIEESTDEDLLRHLITTERSKINIERSDEKWNDIRKFITSNEEEISTILTSGSKTMMGVVSEGAGTRDKFYRTRELLNSLLYLSENDWDIRNELEAYDSRPQKYIRDYLLNLYTRIDLVLEEEKRLAGLAVQKFEEIVGPDPTKKKYMEIVNEIQSLFLHCRNVREFYDLELENYFKDVRPGPHAEQVIGLYEELKNSLKNTSFIDSLRYFSRMPIEKFNETLDALDEVSKFADELEKRRRKMTTSNARIKIELRDKVASDLENVRMRVEKMEVSE